MPSATCLCSHSFHSHAPDNEFDVKTEIWRGSAVLGTPYSRIGQAAHVYKSASAARLQFQNGGASGPGQEQQNVPIPDVYYKSMQPGLTVNSHMQAHTHVTAFCRTCLALPALRHTRKSNALGPTCRLIWSLIPISQCAICLSTPTLLQSHLEALREG